MKKTNLFQDIFADFKRVFPQFLVTDLTFKLLAFVLLYPALSWLLSKVIETSGKSAVSNTDIVNFLLSPIGLLGAVVVSTLFIGISYAEEAGLLSIAYGLYHDRELDWKDALSMNRARAIPVVGLGGMLIVAVLALTIPVAAILGILYLRYLTEYDINYYLQSTPPEFWQALVIAAPLVIGLLAALAYLYISWSIALPSVLFEGVPFRQALTHSRRRIRGSWWRVARILLGWAVGWAIVSILLQLAAGWVANQILVAVGNRLGLLAGLMGLFIVLGAVLSSITGFIGLSVGALLTNRLYVDLATAADAAPRLSVAFLDKYTDIDYSPFPIPLSRLVVSLITIGALLVSAFVGIRLLEGVNYSDSVIITAHRGSSEVAPPNTLAAVQAAIDDGADYAEIDVQETKDGVIIINHDRDFLLAADVPLAVHEATYEEVKELDVGSTFSAEFAGERVPTLEQVLTLARGKIKVNIELKYYGQDQNLVERVVQSVEEADMENAVRIMSLDYDATQEAKRLAPNIPVGFLASAVTVGDLTALDVDFLAVSSGIATTDLINKAHDQGKQLFVWTLNEPTEISRFIGRGVDSIITDRPDIVHEVLAERSAMSDVERLMLNYSHWLAE